ncbi:hypothetical protein J2I47_14805 [Fibrella sp. HMF5335]|uniref:Uncharacterized protein n=1 Tax=Fibrella rubiginis TaxID=2817060 RepID=A0A939GEU1_9BACT|nr:hypothetical protein [Fibrella rubiginis]MBO0937827.1 hypothetical protein [Fibrella rubiginis]
MKSTTIVLLLMASLAVTEAPAAGYLASPTAKEATIFRKKKKGFRRKKGFLWGLFKKNDCGCPNH